MHCIWVSFFCMWKVKELVAQSFPSLCDSMDYIACQGPLSMEFSRQEYWSGLPFPFPKGLPDPRIELGYPTLQSESLLSEPPVKSWKSFQIFFFSAVRQGSIFILLPVENNFFQHHLLKWLSFPYWLVLAPLSKIVWPYMWGFISKLCSTGLCALFLCQYCIILITIVLKFSLK